MARASSVLPVPGGPINKTPLGSLPPSLVNFEGERRNSTISSSSSLASSAPRTSSNLMGRVCACGSTSVWMLMPLPSPLSSMIALTPLNSTNPSSSSRTVFHTCARIPGSCMTTCMGLPSLPTAPKPSAAVAPPAAWPAWPSTFVRSVLSSLLVITSALRYSFVHDSLRAYRPDSTRLITSAGSLLTSSLSSSYCFFALVGLRSASCCSRPIRSPDMKGRRKTTCWDPPRVALSAGRTHCLSRAHCVAVVPWLATCSCLSAAYSPNLSWPLSTAAVLQGNLAHIFTRAPSGPPTTPGVPAN
eukprot:comp23939_c0_seq1/m.42300 comp23939_c0_seq1/g.42300  ORF comp23939_c0_seq1/g.42300 comp23939_c0_seq1/m.42300 type:complete len:301 (+) comp23939_c0_seq1:228-1130(+)